MINIFVSGLEPKMDWNLVLIIEGVFSMRTPDQKTFRVEVINWHQILANLTLDLQ